MGTPGRRDFERAIETLRACGVEVVVRMPDAPLLTAAQAAERLGMSVSWVHRHRDELGPVLLPGGDLRFSGVNALISRCSAHATP